MCYTNWYCHCSVWVQHHVHNGRHLTILCRILKRYTKGFISACNALIFSGQGIVSAVKAALSESSDNTNQAIGMAVLTSAYGTGILIGQALSGAIADPVGQYNLTITSKFLL